MGNSPPTSEKRQNEEESEPSPPPPPPTEPPAVAAAAQPLQSQTNTTEPENLTCEICIEPMLLPNKLFKNGRLCSHPFCTDCINKYIQAKLDDNISKIPCPALNCPQFLDPISCRIMVSKELFVRWSDGLCDVALSGYSRSYCPNRSCLALIVNECGGDVKKVDCPNCKRPFCFQCQLTWHSGFRCEESREFRDRNDRAFGVLVERRNWKRCPQCRHFVELIEGCRIVKCRCGTRFCYTCGGKFNGIGCECRRNHRVHDIRVRDELFAAICVAFCFMVFMWLFMIFPR